MTLCAAIQGTGRLQLIGWLLWGWWCVHPMNVQASGLQAGAPWPTSFGGNGAQMAMDISGPIHSHPMMDEVFQLGSRRAPRDGRTPTRVHATPVTSADGRVYVLATLKNDQAQLIALQLPTLEADSQKAEVAWKLALGGTITTGRQHEFYEPGWSGLAIGKTGVVYVSLPRAVVAVSRDGERLWYRPMDKPTGPVIAPSGDILVASGKRVHRINAAGRGHILFEASYPLRGLALVGDRLYLEPSPSATPAFLTVIDPVEGGVVGVWKSSKHHLQRVIGVGDREAVAISLEHRSIHVAGADWRADGSTGSSPLGMVPVGDDLLLLSAGKEKQLLRMNRAGEERWRATVPGKPNVVVVDREQTAYVLCGGVREAPKLVAVDRTGTIRMTLALPWWGTGRGNGWNLPYLPYFPPVPTLDGRLLLVSFDGVGRLIGNPPPPHLVVSLRPRHGSLADDEALNPSEEWWFRVKVTNDGQGAAHQAKLTVEIPEGPVTARMERDVWYRVPPGRSLPYDLILSATPDLPDGTLPMTLQVTDENGFSSAAIQMPLRQKVIPVPTIRAGQLPVIDDRPEIFAELSSQHWRPGDGFGPGDGDGLAENGETIVAYLPIQPVGGTLYRVRYELSVSDGNTVLGASKGYLPQVDRDTTAYLIAPIGFSELMRTPEALISIQVDDGRIGDTDNVVLTYQVPVHIERPELSLRYHLLDDGTGGSAGNGDGTISPGETVALVVQVDNLGQREARSGTIQVSTAGSGFMLRGAGGALGDVPPGSRSKEATVLLTPQVQDGLITLGLRLQAEGVSPSELILNLPVVPSRSPLPTKSVVTKGDTYWVPIETAGLSTSPDLILPGHGGSPWWAIDQGALWHRGASGSWTRLDLPAAGSSLLARTPGDGQRLYYGVGQVIHHSMDGGQSWQVLGALETLDPGEVQVLRCLSDGHLLLGATHGLFRWDGAKWTSLLRDHSVHQIRTDGTHWAALTDDGRLLHTIGGDLTEITSLPAQGGLLLALQKDRLYLATAEGDLWTRFGTRWKSQGKIPLHSPLKQLFATSRGLIASTEMGVQMTRDQGTSWEAIGGGQEIQNWSVVGEGAGGLPIVRAGSQLMQVGTVARREVLQAVLFESGSAALKAEVPHALADIAQLPVAVGGATIVVEGHTDNIGPADYNRTLSLDRAEAVRQFLVRQGLSLERVVARGFGMDRPLVSNEDAEGRAQNRRVEIIVVRTDQTEEIL